MNVLPGILATMRCLRLSAGLGVVRRFSRHDGWRLLHVVDQAVAPLVRQSLTDPAMQERALAAFRIAAVKFGVGIWAYATMAGLRPNLELIALSTAFTRLYDDLMDHGLDHSLDDRFERILHGGNATPSSELERLMHALFHAWMDNAGRCEGQFLDDFSTLHGWQRVSRRQREDKSITAPEVDAITRAKGELGILVLYRHGRTSVDDDERKIIAHIGAVGQTLDDLHDLAVDRMDGIRTPATMGHAGVWRAGRETARLARRLRAYFGAHAARDFNGLLFLYLAGLVFRRSTIKRRHPPAARTPFRMLIGRTHNILPERKLAAA